MPRSTRPELPFEMMAHERHQIGILLLMSHFFVGYLRDLYRHFEGDMALVIVLGEIANHNMTAHFMVERGERREVGITPKVGEYFQPDLNLNLLAGLLQTSDRIRSSMDT